MNKIELDRQSGCFSHNIWHVIYGKINLQIKININDDRVNSIGLII